MSCPLFYNSPPRSRQIRFRRERCSTGSQSATRTRWPQLAPTPFNSLSTSGSNRAAEALGRPAAGPSFHSEAAFLGFPQQLRMLRTPIVRRGRSSQPGAGLSFLSVCGRPSPDLGLAALWMLSCTPGDPGNQNHAGGSGRHLGDGGTGRLVHRCLALRPEAHPYSGPLGRSIRQLSAPAENW